MYQLHNTIHLSVTQQLHYTQLAQRQLPLCPSPTQQQLEASINNWSSPYGNSYQLHGTVSISNNSLVTPYISQLLNNCITPTTTTATTTACDRSNNITLPPLKHHTQPSKFETSVQQEKDT